MVEFIQRVLKKFVEKTRREVDLRVREYGENAVFEVGIGKVHPDLMKILGRLNYRHKLWAKCFKDTRWKLLSYPGVVAAELGEDVKLVTERAGLAYMTSEKRLIVG